MSANKKVREEMACGNLLIVVLILSTLQIS